MSGYWFLSFVFSIATMLLFEGPFGFTHILLTTPFASDDIHDIGRQLSEWRMVKFPPVVVLVVELLETVCWIL